MRFIHFDTVIVVHNLQKKEFQVIYTLLSFSNKNPLLHPFVDLIVIFVDMTTRKRIILNRFSALLHTEREKKIKE